MGAQQFTTSSPLTDVGEAYSQCVDDAYWNCGHAGYTGTIAEKEGFVVFPVPEGHTVPEMVEILERAWDASEQAQYPWMPSGIWAAYDDKWGPAVALQDKDESWTFCGWASS